MRPAKGLVELASSFPCEVRLIAKGREADGKSILELIGLGVECGDEVLVRCEGPGAAEAVESLRERLASLPELHREPEDA